MPSFDPSPQQQAIFDWIKNGTGHALVRARAGTGKTTTCVQAIGKIPAHQRVLVLAFNKTIASEFESRLTASGWPADVYTLHSLGLMALRRQWRVQGAPDKTRDKRLAAQALGARLERHAGTLASVISLLKSRLEVDEESVSAAIARSDVSLPVHVATEAALTAMGLSLEKDNTFSFDDMVFVPAANNWRTGNYDWVIVDETQDMSAAQLVLAKNALAIDGRMIIVGDDRQAIYAWRGADPEGVDRMKAELNAVELPLSVTYRCPKSVVAEASRAVPDLECPPTSPEGEILVSNTETVAWQPGEAVLSRTNAPLVSLALKALREGIPARIRGREFAVGLRQWARNLAGTTIPEVYRSADDWKTDEISKLSEEDSERLTEILDRVETLRALGEGLKSLSGLFDRLESLFADDANESETLLFSSVHRAKGLEWDVVYLVAGTFRPSRSREEENLWYVALTRSKHTLVYLTGVREISDTIVSRAVESARTQKAVA